MVTTPEEYPLWRTPQPIIVQRNQPHKYIYSLFEGDCGWGGRRSSILDV